MISVGGLMFLCKFFDDITGSNVNYLYLNKNSELVGFSLNKYGFCEFDYNTFNEIKKSLFFNENCYKLINYKEYEIFFDPYTKFKHYLKDGKEDFELFFKYNGQDAIEYNGKNFFPTIVKIFVVGSICLILSNSFFYKDFKVIQEYKNYRDIEYIEIGELNYSESTINSILNHINNSPNLSDSDKNLLCNEDLFTTISSYYGENTNDILIRLKNITVNESTNEEDQYFAKNQNVMGYYSPLEPNVINIRANLDDYSRDHTLIHEFIHLLQNKNSKYPFFSETVAELITDEIFGYHTSGYNKSVNVLKRLIDVIGPVPILKGCFGYDYTMLENILADNLSMNEYKELTRDLFTITPDNISSAQLLKIEKYIHKIHFNITGKNFKEDADILYNCVYGEIVCDTYDFPELLHRKKTYLTTSKMEDEEVFYVELEYNNNKEKLIELGLIQEVDVYQIYKKLSYEEYINLKNSNLVSDLASIYNIRQDIGKYDFLKKEFIVYKNVICDNQYDIPNYSYSDPTEVLSLEDAVKRGYVVICINDYIHINKELPQGFDYVVGDFNTAPLPVKKVVSNSENIYVDGELVKIIIPGIKKRFDVKNHVVEDSLVSNFTYKN